MKLSERSQKVNASMTLALSAKAGQMKTDGHDVVSFGAGEPDFNTPEHIAKAGKKAIDEGFTKYTAAAGTKDLKKAVQKKFKKDNGLDYDLDQIIISNGAKHSLFNTFQTILNPGDEVIISRPYWVSYPETVKLGGGVPVYVDAEEENNFKMKIEDIKKAVTENTKALILNSPNNPTGCVYSREELKEIADLAIKEDFFVVSDEIYEELIYGDAEHISIASFGKEIKERTIVINGMSKAYAMTGWRIGFAAASKEIVDIMSNIQSHATSNPNSIAQYASTVGLNESKAVTREMVKAFKERRNYMVKTINEMPKVSCKKPEGAFYVMMNIENLIGKKYEGEEIDGSMSFADILLEESKVAVIPGKAFGNDKFVRLSYATSLEDIKRGLERIKEFVNKVN
ncbi:MAG TPA: pyridoxal phosphate-dependent aminotransferase [Halanaerobiales bacterium]|nr:pyridoxal phosphate-dependent aminotransferase [Halanaerobiales bacterium]